MIDDLLETAMTASGLPGLTAMAATANRVIHSGAYGAKGDVPMTLDTVFRLASMTKPIVSATVLRVAAQGLLSLDAPISDHVPEVATPPVLAGFSDSGEPILRPASRPITLRQLLSHSAGYANNFFSAEFDRYLRYSGQPRRADNAAQLSRLPLLFEPGAGWAYSGINTDIAGLAAQRVTGTPLAELIAREVTGPLGMKDTTYLPRPEQVARLAPLFEKLGDGKLRETTEPIPTSLPFLYGGGGLFSTAPDYIAFLQAVLNGSLLPSRLQAEFIRPQLPAAPGLAQLTSCNPISVDCDIFDGEPASWSLGFLVNTKPLPQGRSAFSHCWAGIYNTHFWLDFTRGTCGVFMAQFLPFYDPGAIRTLRIYEGAVNGMSPTTR